MRGRRKEWTNWRESLCVTCCCFFCFGRWLRWSFGRWGCSGMSVSICPKLPLLLSANTAAFWLCLADWRRWAWWKVVHLLFSILSIFPWRFWARLRDFRFGVVGLICGRVMNRIILWQICDWVCGLLRSWESPIYSLSAFNEYYIICHPSAYNSKYWWIQ